MAPIVAFLAAQAQHLSVPPAAEIVYLCAGMVAEAMAVELPSSKSAPVVPKPKVKCSFWPFGRNKSAYKALKDVDAPVKRKDPRDTQADDDTDDGCLLKAGAPTAAKYAEKLSRKNATEDEEPFVPRPNSRIKFKLPEKTPSEDSAPEVIPTSTAQDSEQPSEVVSVGDAEVNAADPVASPENAPLIPAIETTSANDTAAADELKTLI